MLIDAFVYKSHMGLVLQRTSVRPFSVIIIFILLFFIIFDNCSYGGSLCDPGMTTLNGRSKTVADVVKQLGPQVDSSLKPYFAWAGVPYPPSRVALIGLKEEMKLELWASKDDTWVHVRTYDIYAASGVQGPKQKRGDRQVPEGIYQITSLNPNSTYHLSMKLNYPNSYDLAMARYDKRSNLGGDIFIHGSTKSVGCLAVGNRTIEEVFVLVATIGVDNVSVMIAPYDLRKETPNVYLRTDPTWLPSLYKSLGQEMVRFRFQNGFRSAIQESGLALHE